jgi:hypothetical protein
MKLVCSALLILKEFIFFALVCLFGLDGLINLVFSSVCFFSWIMSLFVFNLGY